MPKRMQDPGARGVCLVVDDDRADQESIVRSIRRCGISVPILVAETIAAARVVLARQRVRLVLLENTLPDGYGVDFAVELCAQDAHRHLPIVLVTDWPSPFMFVKARRAGIRDILGTSDFVPDRARALLAG